MYLGFEMKRSARKVIRRYEQCRSSRPSNDWAMVTRSNPSRLRCLSPEYSPYALQPSSVGLHRKLSPANSLRRSAAKAQKKPLR